MIKKAILSLIILALLIPNNFILASSFEVKNSVTNGNVVVSWANTDSSAYLVDVYQDNVKTHSNWVYGTSWSIQDNSLTGDVIKFLVAPPGQSFSESVYVRNYKQKPIAYSPVGETTNHTVWFSWNATIDANKYYFQLYKADGTKVSQYYVYGESKTSNLALVNGQYKWRVIPLTAENKQGLPSDWTYFIVNDQAQSENVFGVEKSAELPPLATSLTYPESAIVGGDGAIYVSDSHSNVIRRCTSEKCEIYVGNLLAGNNGDGFRTDIMIDQPGGMFFDKENNLIYSDIGNKRIRKVDSKGNVTTVWNHGKWAKNVYAFGNSLMIGANDGKIYLSNGFELKCGESYLYPSSISIEGDLIVILDSQAKKLFLYKNGKLHKTKDLESVAAAVFIHQGIIYLGEHTTLYKLDQELNATVFQTDFVHITNINLGEDGQLIVSDSDDGTVKSVDLSTGLAKLEVGSKTVSGAVVDIEEYNGDLYFLDNQSASVWKFDPRTGVTEKYIGNGSQELAIIGSNRLNTGLFYPTGLAIDGTGNFYISEQHHIIKVSTSGTVSLFAGGSGRDKYGFKDGTTQEALFLGVRGLSYNKNEDSLYIADTYNNRIRKVKNGEVTTVAGDGSQGVPTFELSAQSSHLTKPHDVLVVGNELYVADSWNNTVSKIDANGIIHHVAGMVKYSGYQGEGRFTGDSGDAKLADLNTPIGLFEREGKIYIADNFNSRVRVVENGIINTVIGSNVKGYDPNNPLTLNMPSALYVNDEYVYVADTGNYLVRRYDKSILD